MYLSKWLLGISLVYLIHSTGLAQTNLRVSVMNQALSLPSLNVLHLPLHPGLTIGSDLLIKNHKRWHTTLGADLTFFHHRLSENALMLDAVYGLGYKFDFGLQPRFLAALGYKHSLAAGEVYKLRDGAYEKTFYWGKPQFNFKVGFGFEYPLSRTYSLTTDYKTMIALPYSQKIAFSLHTLLSVGIKVNLKN
ncbi:hypothetical protein [Arundinibacter roseus]|uniref:Outer membrane protein beta-barrel domain-containing protein n=1 Tax=Arundinibacter roseus TaxID=2070510 RepID=A0A4R4K979_9BACT|nr:hypothetical protein [Arundinibacter roseus]TDB62749.1 hypothetical protein EZE20_17595 [Arundinibacter roseus]